MDMVQHLKRIRRSMKYVRKKNIILMQLSSWDFTVRGHRHILNKLPELLVELKVLASDVHFNNSKLILLNGQPSPDLTTTKQIKRPTKHWSRGYSNNFITQVFNYKIRKGLEKTKIDMVDMFSLLYPRNKEAVCKQHYLCRPYFGPQKLIGKLGPIMMQYIMSHF